MYAVFRKVYFYSRMGGLWSRTPNVEPTSNASGVSMSDSISKKSLDYYIDITAEDARKIVFDYGIHTTKSDIDKIMRKINYVKSRVPISSDLIEEIKKAKTPEALNAVLTEIMNKIQPLNLNKSIETWKKRMNTLEEKEAELHEQKFNPGSKLVIIAQPISPSNAVSVSWMATSTAQKDLTHEQFARLRAEYATSPYKFKNIRKILYPSSSGDDPNLIIVTQETWPVIQEYVNALRATFPQPRRQGGSLKHKSLHKNPREVGAPVGGRRLRRKNRSKKRPTH